MEVIKSTLLGATIASLFFGVVFIIVSFPTLLPVGLILFWSYFVGRAFRE